MPRKPMRVALPRDAKALRRMLQRWAEHVTTAELDSALALGMWLKQTP